MSAKRSSLKMLHSNDYEEWDCLQEAATRFIRSKYIDCEDRCIKRAERQSRLKFPRQTPKKANVIESSAVFSRDIALLKQTPTRLADDVVVSVPFFLILLVEEIRKHIELEGILRKAGSLARQKWIVDDINKGNYKFDQCNTYDLCAVLKKFVRSIPGGLIPNRLKSVFLGARKHHDATEEYDPLLASCLLLDKPRLHLLIFLLRFLNEITMHKRKNLMDMDNLATVFGPNLFEIIETPAAAKGRAPPALESVGADRTIVRMLIINSFRIGYIPQAVEKEANEIRIDNQEEALVLIASSSAHKSRSFFRSVSSKPRRSRLDQCCDDSAPEGTEQTPKRSKRNRSLFARKKRRDTDAHASTPKTPLNAFTKLKQKAKIFCSISEEESSDFRPSHSKFEKIVDGTPLRQIAETSASANATGQQSEISKASTINSFSLRLSINTNCERHRLSCIAEAKNDSDASNEGSIAKQSPLNVAIVENEENIESRSTISGSKTGFLLPNNVKAIRTVLASLPTGRPLSSTPCGDLKPTQAPEVPATSYEETPAKLTKKPAFVRFSLPAGDDETVQPDKASENPLMFAYKSCDPELRSAYLHEFIRDVGRTVPRSLGRSAPASSITARQLCEPVSGASWLRDKPKFKAPNRRKRCRKDKLAVLNNKGTPV